MTDTLGNETQPLDPKIRKQLKKQDRELKDLKAKLAAKERENAFISAGIPNDTKGHALMKVYDGDMEPAKIRATYEELFGELGVEDDGLSAAERIARAGQGGGSPQGSGVPAFEDALRAAKGDNAKILELIANAPPGAGIKLPDIQ